MQMSDCFVIFGYLMNKVTKNNLKKLKVCIKLLNIKVEISLKFEIVLLFIVDFFQISKTVFTKHFPEFTNLPSTVVAAFYLF